MVTKCPNCGNSDFAYVDANDSRCTNCNKRVPNSHLMDTTDMSTDSVGVTNSNNSSLY